MSKVFSCLNYHIVFGTKGRRKFISEEWEKRFHRYMAGIIRNENSQCVIIGGADDHVHIVLKVPSSKNPSDLIRKIKCNSSKWVKFLEPGFEWQNGYGIFSVSESQLSKLIRYVKNQRDHHRVKSYEEEVMDFMKKHNVKNF
jgi:putative transposase